MYNGIGLQTARGSGTNGYVQRNLSFVRTTKEKINFRSEADLIRLEAESQKGPNAAILEHARKRALELKSAEMEDVMREQGYTESEVREKVAQYRAMLMEREQNARPSTDSSHIMGRPNVRETHAVAEAQQQKNARLKEAFGISEFFVEGSSLDPDRRTKEEAARQAHIQQEERRKRRHEWVNTPSPSPTPTPSEQKDRKEKKKKKKRARDRSSSRESRKKRKSKKSKRSRSSSPKKKKRCREKKKKGKTKKKRKSCTASSSSSSSSPSASDGRKSIRRRSSKKTKSSNSKQGGSSNNDGKVKKSFDNANKQLNSKPESSAEEIEARRLNATSDPAREATCIDLEEEIKEIPYNALEKMQSAKRYENQEEGTIKKAEGQTSALPQSESSELKLIESPKPTYNLNNIQMPEPSALHPPYSHNHFIPPIPTIEMNEGSVKRIDYLCPKKGTLDSSAKINLNLNNETIQDRIKGKGPFSAILTNSNDDQVNAKRDLQTCSSSFHRFANLNLSKEDLLRPIHPSFSPPRAHPSFSPPRAQTGISMISQNGSKLREGEEKSTPKNKSSPTIIEVSSKMRPSRRNRSSSHSSSSSRSRSRSRSSTSLSPLRHSRSPTSKRSRSKSKSHSVSKSRSRSRSHSRSRSRSRSRTNSHSKSRSRSRSKTRSRSRSYSHSCSKTGSRSRTRSQSAGRYSRSSMSRSRTRSRSTISRSRSRSLTRSRSRSQTKSRSRSKSKSRSPSIPRRKGSPSFLDKRRITSARKRPVPYHRPSPPPSPSSSDSESSWWSRSRSQSRSRSRSWSRTRSPSYSR